MDINNVFLIGRLTRDPIQRQAGEATLAQFSLAVNGYKKSVSFIDCTAWNKTAEIVMSYCRRGKQVAVSGELRQERWEKDGQKHSKLTVHINSLQLLGGNTQDPQAMAGEEPQAGQDDDIPF